MQSYSVVLDANVLYSATLRDTMMWLSQTDLFKARWTDGIRDEWITALTRRGYDRSTLDRLLDPANDSVLLETLKKVAQATGQHLEVRLVSA